VSAIIGTRAQKDIDSKRPGLSSQNLSWYVHLPTGESGARPHFRGSFSSGWRRSRGMPARIFESGGCSWTSWQLPAARW
jgi:hypothetical protein